MFPDNLFRATFQQVETEYVFKNISTILVETIAHKHVDGMNILGLIVFFIVMGLVMGSLGNKVRHLVDLFIQLDIVITTIVNILMW